MTDPACTCTPYSQDAGGGYFEYLLEPDPQCPVHCRCGYDHRIPVKFNGVGRTDG